MSPHPVYFQARRILPSTPLSKLVNGGKWKVLWVPQELVSGLPPPLPPDWQGLGRGRRKGAELKRQGGVDTGGLGDSVGL